MRKGTFIAFEGIDGSGKSTQIARLARRLKKSGTDLYTTAEPSGSPIGALIRQILSGQVRTDPKAIAALFVADRLDHLLNESDGIAKKVRDGSTVITDRYYFSSYAYHGVDMPMDWVILANKPCSDILRPDVTVFLDIGPDAAMRRIVENRQRQELFEKESRLAKVRENYFKAFDLLKEKENVVTVDAGRSESVTEEEIWQAVRQYLE